MRAARGAGVGGAEVTHHAIAGARDGQPRLVADGREGRGQIDRVRQNLRQEIRAARSRLGPWGGVHIRARQFDHGIAGGVGHKNVARRVHRDTGRMAQAGQRHRGQRMSQRAPFQDHVVGAIGDIHVARPVHSDPGRTAQPCGYERGDAAGSHDPFIDFARPAVGDVEVARRIHRDAGGGVESGHHGGGSAAGDVVEGPFLNVAGSTVGHQHLEVQGIIGDRRGPGRRTRSAERVEIGVV